MAHVGPGGRHQGDVLVRRPNAVPASNLRSQEAQVVKVLQRGLVPGLQPVELLVNRFLQVDVDAGAVACGHFFEGYQHLVGTPVDVAGRHDDLNPLVAVVAVLGADLLQDGHDIGHRPVAAGHERPVSFRQIAGHPRREFFLAATGPGHHGILVGDGRSVRHPHPRVLVGLHHFVSHAQVYRGNPAPGGMDRLHRGRARLDHLDRAV